MAESVSEILLSHKVDPSSLKMVGGVVNGGDEIVDPGFFEEDIKASIEDVAQGHVKWIYDCILARLDGNCGMRMSQAERHYLRSAAFNHYKSYVEAVLLKMQRNSP